MDCDDVYRDVEACGYRLCGEANAESLDFGNFAKVSFCAADEPREQQPRQMTGRGTTNGLI
jgi:hypothetical protein